MKNKRDNKQIIYTVIAAILLIGVIIVGYGQIAKPSPKNQSKSVSYKIATPIAATLDQSVVKQLSNPAETQDFSVELNTSTGLGTTNPFGG